MELLTLNNFSKVHVKYVNESYWFLTCSKIVISIYDVIYIYIYYHIHV